MENIKVMILNLPSTPGIDLNRDNAGGYGVGRLVKRKDYGHSFNVVFPVFMPYLATRIRKEVYDLSILDAQAMRLNVEEVIREITNTQPTYIISMICLPSLYGDIHLLNKIKENFPEVFLIGVGAITRFLAGEILEKSRVDFLVDGEYPFYSEPIIKLIRATQKKSAHSVKEIPGLIYREKKNGELLIRHNPFQGLQFDQSLDDLDIQIYDEFPIQAYKLRICEPDGRFLNYFPILSAKGCPFPCIYCPYPIGFGRKIIYKSPTKLVNEMEYLSKTFHINAFLFRDQVFTMDSDRTRQICDLIRARGLKVNWLFETRPDKVTRGLVKEMKAAGCNRIHFGVETGDEKLLQKIGKPYLNKETVKETFKITAEEGIYTMAHVIIGLPGENMESLMNTYKFLLELNPHSVNWNLVTPYPGTKLFDLAKKKNLILTYNWEKYNSRDVVMRTEQLSGEQLIQATKKLARNFKMRKTLRMMRKALYNKTCMEYITRRAIHCVT